MTVIRDVEEMQKTAHQLRRQGKQIAVVPTMGYLHDGHLSLMRIAASNADTVITTLFVNPTQFGPQEDFSRYPRDFDRDVERAAGAGTQYLFTPEDSAMYPEGYATYIEVEKITAMLEGKARPGHFRGVATIVAKLFNITKPHIAVFGQKDAQQVAVIRQMIKDLNFDIQLIVAPIIRESDGLAMSSRNIYLTPRQRSEAVVLSQSLKLAVQLVNEGERDCRKIVHEMLAIIKSNSSGQIEYVSCAEGQTLRELERIERGQPVLISMAVRFGLTRLIDNVLIDVS